MAFDTYMTVKGRTQGTISGDVSQTNHAGAIRIYDLKLSGDAPFDGSTGQPSGHRVFQPLAVSVPTGRQTPLIFEAFSNAELLTSVDISIFETTQSGTEKKAYSIQLANAVLTSFETNLLGSSASGPFDNYAFTYQNVTLVWNTSNNSLTSQGTPQGWNIVQNVNT